MLSFLLCIVIFIVSFGCGARLLRLLLGKPQAPAKSGRSLPSLLSPTEEFVFAAALGLGIAAYIVFALGMLRLLYSWALWAILLVFAVIGWREILRWIEAVGAASQGLLHRRFSIASIFFTLWLTVLFFLCLTGALAPAGGSDWDGLAYHLAAPKIYLQHHHIMPLPWMSHSNFPFTMEMLYLLGLGLQGQNLAKLINFGFGILLAMAIYCWGNKAFGRGVGIWGTAIFASVPMVLWEATVPYNELIFSLFALLCLWAWWMRNEGAMKGWIVISGIFAGLALGVKMLAGFLVLFMLLAIIWDKVKPLFLRSRQSESALSAHPSLLHTLLLWSIPAILIAAPWYIKSLIWTGNPVYPFFYGLFDGRYWSEALAKQYAIDQSKFGMGHALQWLPALPWTLTMYGYRFYDQPDIQRFFNMVITVFGPLFLAFLPVIFIRARRDILTRYLVSFSGVVIVIWFFLSAQTNRYLMPIIPVLSLAAAGAIALIWDEFRILKRVATVVVGLELLLGAVVIWNLVSSQLPVAAGLEPREGYLTATLDIYPVSQQINTTLPQNARIMIFGDTRGFYLDRDYLWGIGHNNLISPEEHSTPESLMTAFQRLGVTHLLLAPGSVRDMETGQDPLQQSLRSLREQKKLRTVISDGSRTFGFVVYSVAGE